MTKPISPVIDIYQDARYNKSLATTTTSRFAPKLTWKPDKIDSRDYRFNLSSQDIQAVDLRPYCSPVENQGSLGSCTGHAVSSAMEIILKKQNRFTEISRLFIYYQARLLEGTVGIDAGAYLRDCIKACNKAGASAETLWKYNPGMYRAKPSALAYADALKRRVIAYKRCDDFNAVRAALSNETPVIIGFAVYSSFMSPSVAKTGMMPYPNTQKERQLGGHAVCLVGYDDIKQRFIAKNSWGSAWGDKGYFYMPYKVIQNTSMSADFWTISDITR